MNWNQLLSLKRAGDTNKRLRIEQDETRLGFEVDYDRIIFSDSFRSLQDKTQVVPFSKTDCELIIFGRFKKLSLFKNGWILAVLLLTLIMKCSSLPLAFVNHDGSNTSSWFPICQDTVAAIL